MWQLLVVIGVLILLIPLALFAWWIVLLLFLILAPILFLLMWLNKKDDTTDEEVTTPTSNPVTKRYAPATHVPAPLSLRPSVEGYQKHEVEGWTVFVPLPKPELLTQMQTELRSMLQNTNNAVPANIVKTLQNAVPMFLIEKQPNYSTVMSYHPSREWLESNKLDARWAQSVTFQVEGTNWKDYIRTQPGLFWHEMSHAFMHLFWGDSVPGLSQAYQKAVDGGSYDAVLYVPNGERKKAYALTNEKEYFAELSEAYFMKNDYAPVDRQELKSFDPTGYDVIERAWDTK